MKRVLFLIIMCCYVQFFVAQGTVTTFPTSLKADEQGKITFTAAASSPLYNYTESVYVHIGVINNSVWENVPAGWGENLEKCKMTKEGANSWSITLSPTIRAWFGATSQLTKIGLVFRNADGTKKGIASDSFVTVSDAQLFAGLIFQTYPSGIIPTGEGLSLKATATASATLKIAVNGEDLATGVGLSVQKFKYFTTPGTYTITATATIGSTTATDQKTVLVLDPAISQTIPTGTKPGINIISDNSATFVLYEKDNSGNKKDFAFLVGDFNDWKVDAQSVLKRDEAAGCWWTTISGLDPQKEYAFQYQLSSATDAALIKTGDPYSEKILDPWNDSYIPATTYPNLNPYPIGKTDGIVSVFQTKQDPYLWQTTNFQRPKEGATVIYELLLRDFTATSDLNGAMAKLDYLQNLGVNVIQLMPTQEFDGNDSWGYNPMYFFAMDKAYGTKKMYKQFIDECHKRGIAVYLDVVYNHATGNNPFAKLYWNSVTNKTTTNNPWFNVDAPHPYSVFHDFNHESPLVRAFVKRNLAFLLSEYKLDGFRFDLTKGFTQKTSTESTASNKDDSRIAILKDYFATIKTADPTATMIIEHFCSDEEERELSNAGVLSWAGIHGAYRESAKGNNASFTRVNGWGYGFVNNTMVGYQESHDEERTMFDAIQNGIAPIKGSVENSMQRAALNAAFFLPIPGPKMIYQFGELGYDVSINEGGRTGRKPIKWDYLEVPSRKAVHDMYTNLLHLKKQYTDLVDKKEAWNMQITTSDWSAGKRIELKHADFNMIIVGNFQPTGTVTSTPNFSSTGTWYDYLAGTEYIVTATNQTVVLQPNEVKIFTKQRISTSNDAISKTDYAIYQVANEIFINNAEQLKRVQIYNLQGVPLSTQWIDNRVDISHLPTGYYIFSIQTKQEIINLKFVKNN